MKLNVGISAAFVALVLWLAITDSAAQDSAGNPNTQSDKAGVVDEVLDFGKMTLVVQSRNQFITHGKAILEDIGFGGDASQVESLFRFKRQGEFDEDRPIVVYFDNTNPDVLQLPILSNDQVKNRATDKVLSDSDWNRSFKIRNSGFEVPVILSDNFGFGAIKDNRFVVSKKEEKLNRAINAPPIVESLSPSFQRLVNQSGVSMIYRVNKADHPRFHNRFKNDNEQFSEQELQSLKHLDTAIESATRSAMGVTYDKQCLTIRGLVSMAPNEAAGKLFNFDVLDETFRPTLGLPRDHLISSVSLRVDALQSPMVARLIPKIATRQGWQPSRGSEWLSGQMIETAMHLMADTWHDIKAVRLALYRIEDAPSKGGLCVIGVVTPRDPDTIIQELQQLIRLVDPADDQVTASARKTEIARLILDLSSPRFDIRQRATTRLILAGRFAEQQLIQASKSDNLETASRAGKILAKLNQSNRLAAKKFAVGDVKFWSNLRPQFSMRTSTTQLGDYDAHLIGVHPDPGKTPQEVTDATEVIRAMYGDGWNKVYLVRVKNQIAFMFGSDVERLVRTIKNIEQGLDPIANSTAIQKQPVKPGDLQVHISLAQYNNLYYADIEENQVEVNDDNLTTLTLHLAPRDWEVRCHLPISELKVLIDGPFLW